MKDTYNPVCSKCKGTFYPASTNLHHMKMHDLDTFMCLKDTWICDTCLLVDLLSQFIRLRKSNRPVAKRILKFAKKLAKERGNAG